MGADANLSGHPRALSYALNLIIDALSYNKMTLDSGFTAFDVDGDGLISTSDFLSSVDDLQLTTKNELSDISAKFQEMAELLSRTQREVDSCKNQLNVERNGHADTKAVLRTKVEELALPVPSEMA